MPLRITGGSQACRKAGGALAQAACPSRRQRTWRPLLTVLTAARGTCRCRHCRAPLSRSRTRPVRLITCLWCGAKAIDAQLLRHACTAGCLQAWMQPRVATGLGGQPLRCAGAAPARRRSCRGCAPCGAPSSIRPFDCKALAVVKRGARWGRRRGPANRHAACSRAAGGQPCGRDALCGARLRATRAAAGQCAAGRPERRTGRGAHAIGGCGCAPLPGSRNVEREIREGECVASCPPHAVMPCTFCAGSCARGCRWAPAHAACMPLDRAAPAAAATNGVGLGRGSAAARGARAAGGRGRQAARAGRAARRGRRPGRRDGV